jgi:hypothetical protein
MAAHYFIGFQVVQKLPDSPELRGGATQVKTSEQSVNMINAGYSLAVTHNITQTLDAHSR